MNAFEALDRLYENCSDEYRDESKIHEDYIAVKRALEALETINEKNVHIKYFKDSNSLDEYNEYRIYFGNLTRKEYDLLKEVLE